MFAAVSRNCLTLEIHGPKHNSFLLFAILEDFLTLELSLLLEIPCDPLLNSDWLFITHSTVLQVDVDATFFTISLTKLAFMCVFI